MAADMETLKLFIAWALSPLIITMALQILAWGLWARKRRRFALGLLAGSLAFLLVGSLPVFSYERNRTREYVFEPLDLDGDALSPDRPALVVVMGTGFNPDPWLPPNSRVSGAAHARFLEAVRIYRSRPGARLLVSVADIDVEPAEKRKYLDAMVEWFRLAPERVDLVTKAECTEDEATLAAEHRREGERLVVVTTAGHMPRAMKIFGAAGLEPIAAPCDFNLPRKGSPEDKWWKKWIPSAYGVMGTQAMLYEWVAGLKKVAR